MDEIIEYNNINLLFQGKIFIGDKREGYDELQQEIKELLADALYTDGSHHKQWYLWKIAASLGIDLSDQWSEDYPKPDEGIAP